MTSFWIDLVILTGIVAALVWGAVLARRIAKLQAALVELAPALQAFCDAVEQSERSVEMIRRETDRMAEEGERMADQRAAPTAALPVDRNDLVRRFFAAARKKQDTAL